MRDVQYIINTLFDTPPKLPRFNAKKLHDELVIYYEQQPIVSISKLNKLRECKTIKHINIFTGRIYYNYCKLHICPICTQIRAKNKLNKTRKIDNKLAKQGYTTQMITITPYKDVACDYIEQRHNELTKRCTKLFNRKSYKKHVVGSIRAIETSIADTGLYHIHMHLLIVCNGNSLDTVSSYIRKEFDDKEIFLSPPSNKVNTTRFVSYVTKLNNMTAEEWHNSKTETKGKHLVTFTGILRNI